MAKIQDTPKEFYGPSLFLRRPAVLASIGVSAATLQRLVATEQFPAPRRLSEQGRAVAWLRSDIEAWAASRPVSDILPPPKGASPP